jgi:hypothetical protein
MLNRGRASDDAARPDEEPPISSKPVSKEGEQLSSSPTADEIRGARLARIQKKLAAGQYDSDEMLDRAAETMLRKIIDETE